MPNDHTKKVWYLYKLAKIRVSRYQIRTLASQPLRICFFLFSYSYLVYLYSLNKQQSHRLFHSSCINCVSNLQTRKRRNFFEWYTWNWYVEKGSRISSCSNTNETKKHSASSFCFRNCPSPGTVNCQINCISKNWIIMTEDKCWDKNQMISETWTRNEDLSWTQRSRGSSLKQTELEAFCARTLCVQMASGVWLKKR